MWKLASVVIVMHNPQIGTDSNVGTDRTVLTLHLWCIGDGRLQTACVRMMQEELC